MNSDAVTNQSTADDGIALTMIIPMYNEEDIAREAIRRVLAVGRQIGSSFEVLAVDDGSSDGTPHVLAELRATEPNFRWIQLRPNCGQPAASKAGMLSACGRSIAVLDADMQTPPEIIPQLLSALESAPQHVAAVFGVTSTKHRDDPLRLLVGQAVFYFLQDRLSRHPMPHGASSFFVMRRDVARRIARLPFRDGNVGAVTAALGLAAESRFYVKPRSYREESRLGLNGHVREALGSLALSGGLSRLGIAGTMLTVPVAVGLLTARSSAKATVVAIGAVGCMALIMASECFTRAALDNSIEIELPIFEGEAATTPPAARFTA